jgi:hypothetical protein
MWWYVDIISALRRWGQEESEFKASYIARSRLACHWVLVAHACNPNYSGSRS